MAGLNDNLKKANELLNKIASKYAELGKKNLFAGVDPQKIAQSDQEIQRLEEHIKGLDAQIQDMNDSLSDTYNAWQSIVTEAKGAKNAINQYNKTLSDSQSLSRQIRDHNLGTSILNEKQLKKLKEKLKTKKSDLSSTLQELRVQKQGLIDENKRGDISFAQKKKNRDLIKEINDRIKHSNSALKDGEGLYDQELSRIKEIEGHHKQINKELGFAPQLAAGLDNILKRMGLPDLGVSDALEEAKELGMAAKAQGKDFNTLAHFTGKMKENFIGAFTKANLLAGVITGLISGFMQSQKGIGDLAKGLGMSATRAADMRKDFANIANLSQEANVSVKGLQEAQMAVGAALGSNAQLNEEDLVTMTKLVKQTGLQHSELMGIQKLSLATGKNLKDNVKEGLGAAKAFALQNGMAINVNKVLKDMNSATSSFKLALGGSTEKLGEAVVKVQKLGLDLQKAAAMSQSLLNFESSIEAELEAELLTGKNLNLERARQLALEGNIAEAAAEMADQLGSAAEFGEMNVIQQEALAKSVGMTKDQLGDMLIEQEALAAMNAGADQSAQERYQELLKEGKTRKEILDMVGEDAMRQLEEQSAQDKFNASVEKLKEIFTQVMDALSPIFNMLSTIATTVLPLVNLAFEPIRYTLEAISNLLTGNTEEMSTFQKIVGAIGIGMGVIYGLSKATFLVEQLTTLTKVEQMSLGAAILTTMGFQNAVAGYQLAREEGMNVFRAIGVGLEETKLGVMVSQGYQFVKNTAKLAYENVLRGIGLLLEETKLAAMVGQGFAMMKNIAKLAIENTLRLAGMVTAFMTNAASTFGVGVAIAIAAGLAGIGIVAGIMSSMKDGLIGPGGNPILFGEKGAIQLDSEDSMIVGTDLNGKKSGKKEEKPIEKERGEDRRYIRQTNVLLQTLIDTIKTEGVVKLDGQKVGEALKLGAYQSQ